MLLVEYVCLCKCLLPAAVAFVAEIVDSCCLFHVCLGFSKSQTDPTRLGAVNSTHQSFIWAVYVGTVFGGSQWPSFRGGSFGLLYCFV